MTSRPRDITVRRIYAPAGPDDGYRVLVDRRWPSGLARADAALDEWCPDVAPTPSLRWWYGHLPTRFADFRERYLVELDDPGHAAVVAHLRAAPVHRLTLLTAARDLGLSHATVLAERLSWGRATERPALTRVYVDQ